MKNDPVNNPAHYQLFPGIEVIDVRDVLLKKVDAMKSKGEFSLSASEIDCWSRSWEYMTRFMSKDGLQDLKRAKFYLDRMIQSIEGDIELKEEDLVEGEDIKSRSRSGKGIYSEIHKTMSQEFDYEAWCSSEVAVIGNALNLTFEELSNSHSKTLDLDNAESVREMLLTCFNIPDNFKDAALNYLIDHRKRCTHADTKRSVTIHHIDMGKIKNKKHNTCLDLAVKNGFMTQEHADKLKAEANV